MSQNARLDPTLNVPATRPKPGARIEKGRTESTGLLGRLSVGQKLAFTAGLFALPITALLYLTASGRTEDIRFVQREQAGANQVAPFIALQSTIFEYVGAKNAGSVAKAKASAQAVDQAIQTLTAGLGQQGLNESQAAVGLLADQWKQLKGTDPGPGGLLLASSLAQFGTDQMLPNQETLLSDSFMLLDPTATSYYAIQTAFLRLPELLTHLTTLTVLARSIEELKDDPNFISVAAPIYRNEATRAGLALDNAFDAMKRAEASDESLSATIGEATRNLESIRQTLSAASTADLTRSVGERAAPQRLEEAVNEVTAAIGLGTKEVNRLLSARVDAQRTALFTELLTVGLITLLAALLLLAVARAITRPLGRLATSARALEQGDLSVSVPVTTRDELGVVGQAFNAATATLRLNQEKTETERLEAVRLQANVAEFLDVTMDIADGDLTRRGKVTEDVLGNVVDSINLMTEELASVLGDVQRASASVTDGSQAMLTSTEQIRQGTLITAEETGRVTRQAQAMTVAIGQMSATAKASADSAQRAVSASETGQQAVSSTLKGMEAIRESSRSVSGRVQSLTQRSEQIEEIVDSISHIASQVNLLSLHASIEAAGAGESGKRFAVVAEEIRELADLSTEATARIAGLIAEIQGDVRGVAQEMQANSVQVEQGYLVAGQAGEALREIGELAGVTAHFAQNISDAAREQVQEVQGMSGAVTQIAAVAQQSQTSAEEGRAVAEQLQALAVRLSGSLTRFRLPG